MFGKITYFVLQDFQIFIKCVIPNRVIVAPPEIEKLYK